MQTAISDVNYYNTPKRQIFSMVIAKTLLKISVF